MQCDRCRRRSLTLFNAGVQLSLSRGDKWDPTPTDETVDLISSLDHPAFDVLDYLNWCRFLDKDMKATIGPDDN